MWPWVVIAGVLAATSVAAETVSSDPGPIVAAMRTKLSAVRTIHYREQSVSFGGTQTFTLDTTGGAEVVAQRAGAKVRVRVESTGTERYLCKARGCGEEANSGSDRSLEIFDGTHMYLHSKQPGLESASKGPAKGRFTLLDAADVFAARENVTFHRAPDITLDGALVHLIIRTVEGGGITFYYVDPATGLLRLAVGIDPDATLHVRRYTDVRLDAPVAPSAFVFTAPPGVTVTSRD